MRIREDRDINPLYHMHSRTFTSSSFRVEDFSGSLLDVLHDELDLDESMRRER